jgi:hypothetical protein
MGTVLARASAREPMSTPRIISRSVELLARPPLTRAARENIVCAVILAAGLGIGLAFQLLVPYDRTTVLALTGGLALATALLALVRRLHLRDTVGSFRFAGVLLAVIAIAVAIGTFIPQDKPAEMYAERYGGAAALLVATGVTSLFHSFWFGALLGVLGGGLTAAAVRRWPPNVNGLGFFLCHVGLILILAGSAVSFSLARRGRVDLRVGAEPATAAALTRAGARTGESADLGFAVRLDGFKVDRYEAEHRLAVYELQPDGGARQLAVLDEDEGVNHRLPDRARYRVIDHEAQPAAAHLIAEEDGHGHSWAVNVGDQIALHGGAVLRVVKFYPSFYYDLESRSAASASDSPDNPALEVQIAEPGAEPRRQFLVMSQPGFVHGGGRAGLAYRYAPDSAGGEPAITVEVRDERGTRRATLVPSRRDAIFFGERKALTYERRPEEAKAYRSSITVIGPDGSERPLSVAVNAPASINGWSLYQVNYDPRDPTYSGLEAVHDPGIPVAFVGFGLVVIGVPYMVNLAPWLRRRQAKSLAHGETKGDRS